MCFFTLKFRGMTYNKQAALTLMEYQQKRIEDLEKQVASLEADLLASHEETQREIERRRATESEVGHARSMARTFKAELDKLRAKAPIRGKGGRFVSKKKPN